MAKRRWPSWRAAAAPLRRHTGESQRRHHRFADRLPQFESRHRAAYRAEKRPIGSAPRIGYVTANLNVSYLKPTPLKETIQLRARIMKLEGRKAWVNCTFSAAGEIRATGEVLGVRVEWE